MAIAALLLPGTAGGEALLPIPGLDRPEERDDERPGKMRVLGGCKHKGLPSLDERLPFGPGERMSYDVSLLGIRTGRVHMRIDERIEMDGVSVYPVHASARTEGLVSVLGELDGRMVSFMDPRESMPIRMVNRFQTSTITSPPTLAREDAAFSRAKVAGRLYYRADGKERTRPAKLSATSDLLDVLTAMYYMRSRAMVEGNRYCFEVYHRRRLWRVTGEIRGLETISSPYGTRRSRKIVGTLEKIGGSKKVAPREIKAWVSADDDRLPLLVQTPDNIGTLEVKLSRYKAGRKLVRQR